MAADYHHRGHSVRDLKYHLIWVSKYRFAVLKGDVAIRCRDLIREICQAREVNVVRGAVSPDHGHLLVSAPPILAPAKLGAVPERQPLAALAGRVPEPAKTLLGSTLVGPRRLLRDGRSGGWRRRSKRYIEEQKWDDDGEGQFRIVTGR